MTDKESDINPRPGVPEALNPDIGNGAIWESDPHDYILRSIDPLIKLDLLLLDENTRQRIIDHWNGHPDPDQKNKITSLTTENPVLRNDAEEQHEVQQQINPQTSPEIKSRKASIREPEEENKPVPSASETKLSSPITTDTEQSAEKTANEPSGKTGKVGKRVRKVVKTVREERVKSVMPDTDTSSSPMDAHLSPFTKWLKGLRGSEYVHPYEDDYGLDQMAATARGGVSETFADLLASQGHRDQALKMYMQLMEKYPEKSSFFAAKIEALK